MNKREVKAGGFLIFSFLIQDKGNFGEGEFSKFVGIPV